MQQFGEFGMRLDREELLVALEPLQVAGDLNQASPHRLNRSARRLVSCSPAHVISILNDPAGACSLS